MQTMLGVIGGSGVYQIDGLEGASWVKVKTPWGKPSDEVLVGRLRGDPHSGQRGEAGDGVGGDGQHDMPEIIQRLVDGRHQSEPV